MSEASPAPDRLVAESLAKSGLLWVTSAAGSAPCWYAHVKGVAYVVSGPGEQQAPEHEGRVEVITRSKESRARLATFAADADVMSPQDDDWEAAVFALKAGRLNAPGGEDIAARWRDSCRIVRITPDVSTLVVRGRAVTAPAAAPGPGVPDQTVSESPVSAPAAPAPTPPPGTSAAPEPAPDAGVGVGTQAPGREGSAAAAAEREYREALRQDAAPPETT